MPSRSRSKYFGAASSGNALRGQFARRAGHQARHFALGDRDSELGRRTPRAFVRIVVVGVMSAPALAVVPSVMARFHRGGPLFAKLSSTLSSDSVSGLAAPGSVNQLIASHRLSSRRACRRPHVASSTNRRADVSESDQVSASTCRWPCGSTSFTALISPASIAAHAHPS